MQSDATRGATSGSVVPIFGTPFGIVPVPRGPALNTSVAPLFAARAATLGVSSPSGVPCCRSADDLLEWPEDPIRTLASEILQGVRSVVWSINDFTEAQSRLLTMQARGWFTIVPPDGYVPATSYSLTSWCGIYCVEAPERSEVRSDSGVLRLYESRLGTMFSDATNCEMRLPYMPGHYTWRPVPGQLAVFPAWIRHEIALIRSTGHLMLVTVRVRFVASGQEGQSRW